MLADYSNGYPQLSLVPTVVVHHISKGYDSLLMDRVDKSIPQRFMYSYIVTSACMAAFYFTLSTRSWYDHIVVRFRVAL